MKILHILKSVNPAEGGVIEAVTRTTEVLSSYGWERELVSLDRPADPWVKDCPLMIHPMGPRSLLSAWLRRKIPWLRYGLTPHLIPWLRNNIDRFDLIVVNGLWNFSVMAARIVLVRKKSRYVVFTHGMLDPWFRKTYPLKSRIKQ